MRPTYKLAAFALILGALFGAGAAAGALIDPSAPLQGDGNPTVTHPEQGTGHGHGD